MKYFSTVALFLLFFTISGLAQPAYWWVLKQSGNSLGGPADYNSLNTDIIYYGSGSTVYKSTNRGESFSMTGTNVPSTSEIKCIILDDNNPGVFLVASESSPNDKIFKTTNDGATWLTSLDEGQMSYFGIPMEQDPSNPQTIFTMVNNNFKKSTDFGQTWTTTSSNFGTGGAPCDIAVFPGTNIILIGDNGTGIFKSTDYGVTWTQTFYTSGEIPTVSVDYTHPGVAWATKWSGGGGLVKSTDYGSTWTPQSTFSGISMWGVHVQPSDGNVVLANSYSTSPGSWRTIDGGLTWTPISIPSAGYQVMSIDSMTQFAVQSSGIYKLESDNFTPVELASFNASVVNEKVMLNWVTASEINNQGFEIERSFDNQNFSKIGFVPGFGTTTETRSYEFAVTDAPVGIQYYRLKQIDFDGTFAYCNSVEVDGPVPSEFALFQNHPNPFNPSTKISFSLPVESNVKIRLFNMLGQELKVIVNSDFQSGTHSVDFTAEGLSSGAYIYTIEASGINGKNFSSTKKMLMIK